MSEEARLWGTIGERLDQLASRDGTIGFWLRDDDAVRTTPALDRLLAVAEKHGVPLSLAVIPAMAEASLAERLARADRVAVLQHGFSHANHAPPSVKKTELGDHRAARTVLEELAQGRDRLADFPGVAPILVPPWNRIGSHVAEGLGVLGFRALSLYGDRRRNPPAPGLDHFNTHIDPVDWKNGRRFTGRAAALRLIAERLESLWEGEVDIGEPTGILTHHLVHEEEAFIFLSDIVGYLAKRRQCQFLSAGALLANGEGRKAKMGE